MVSHWGHPSKRKTPKLLLFLVYKTTEHETYRKTTIIRESMTVKNINWKIRDKKHSSGWEDKSTNFVIAVTAKIKSHNIIKLRYSKHWMCDIYLEKTTYLN